MDWSASRDRTPGRGARPTASSTKELIWELSSGSVGWLFDLSNPAWTGVSAIATLLAVVVALVAIVLDRRGRTAEERRAQARRVSAWISGWQASMEANDYGGPVFGVTHGIISNASNEPVYRLLAWRVLYPGGPATGEELMRDRSLPGSDPVAIDVVPPGRFALGLPEFVPGMLKRPAVEISFTDSGGRHWIRRLDGKLVEIKSPPAEHYGLSEPVDWGTPHAALD